MCARYVLVESSPERRVGHNLIVSVFLVQLHAGLVLRIAAFSTVALDSDPENCSVGDVSSLFPPILGRLCLTWLVLSLLLLLTVGGKPLPPPSQPRASRLPTGLHASSTYQSILIREASTAGATIPVSCGPCSLAFGGSCLAATEIRLLEMELRLM